MTDRDRLIELIKQATTLHLNYLDSIDQKGLTDTEGRAKFIADHLLANGVIVLPCKAGDSIFRVGNGEIWEWLIEHVEIYEDEIGFVDDGENYFTPDKIGKTVFLTKEEAEHVLSERKDKM